MIKQRHNECQIASICTLNNLSQQDYEAASDLCKEGGWDWRTHSGLIAATIMHELGFIVPKGWGIWDVSPLTTPMTTGIILFRNDFGAHVVAIRDSKIYDTNISIPQELEWEEYQTYAKKAYGSCTFMKFYPIGDTK